MGVIKKEHTNRLLQVLINDGFDRNDFSFERTLASALVVDTKTNLKFQMMPAGNERFDCHFSTFSLNYTWQRREKLEIDSVCFAFGLWLLKHVKEMREELEYPDLWQQLEGNRLAIQDIDFDQQIPFKTDEKEHLKLGLEEVKALVEEQFALSQNELNRVHKRIDYLIAATDRLNKTDWKGIAISTILSIAFDLSFDSSKHAILMGMFSKIWTVVQTLPTHLK